ncbi:hypothetical protein PENTCL1PPCAC_13515, partial [Pristionchus entomophagus]
ESPLPLSMIDIPLCRDSVRESLQLAAQLLPSPPRAFMTVIRIIELPRCLSHRFRHLLVSIGAFPSACRGSSEEFDVLAVQERRAFGSSYENYKAETDEEKNSHLQ